MTELIAPRDVLAASLIELAESYPDILVLDADFKPASKLIPFSERYPERFIQVGVAEQNMMGIAAGLSTVGFIPFVSTIASFVTRRACDQIMVSVALTNLNVKILGVYPGFFVGLNGATHQSLEDISIMRAMANMKVIHPADALETREMLRFAAEYEGPLYIRVGRDPVSQYVPDNYHFRLGKSVTLREGNDLTIITCGDLIGESLSAAEILEHGGIQARLINMSSIKPIDDEAIIKAADETGHILTVDNHNIYGGLGSAVAEVVCENRPVKVKRVGVRDVFGKSGSNEAMLKLFGLTADDIAAEARRLLEN